MKLSKQARAAVLQGLNWVKAHSSVEPNGSLNISFGNAYFLAVELVTYQTHSLFALPEGTYRRAVNLAIRSWGKHAQGLSDNETISQFFKDLDIEIRNLEQQKQTYQVLLFLNTDNTVDKLSPLSILGDQLEIKDWNYLASLQLDALWNECRSRLPKTSILTKVNTKLIPREWDFRPILVRVNSYGPEAAVSIAEDKFDILRAILNMSELRLKITFWRSEPKQHSLFLPSPVFGIFDSEGQYLSFYYTLDKYEPSDYRAHAIKDESTALSAKLLRCFGTPLEYPQTIHHVLSLMRIYQEAIDNCSVPSAFLGLWQVLESAVSFRGETLKQKEIESRINSLLNADNLIQEGIKLFLLLRNRLVHEGQFTEGGDNLLPTLKFITEVLIERLVGLATDFPTVSDLKAYIECLPLNSEELVIRSNAISLIQKHRNGDENTKPSEN